MEKGEGGERLHTVRRPREMVPTNLVRVMADTILNEWVNQLEGLEMDRCSSGRDCRGG